MMCSASGNERVSMDFGRRVHRTVVCASLYCATFAMFSCGGDGGGTGPCTTCACNASLCPPPPTGTVAVTGMVAPLAGTILYAGDSANVSFVGSAANGAIGPDSIVVPSGNPRISLGSSYSGKALAALGSNTVSATVWGKNSAGTAISAAGSAAYTGVAKPVVPDSADIDYALVNPWLEALTNEIFTATFDDGKTLTSSNGHLKGRVPVTATFTLTSPNSFDAKVITTPAAVLSAATDTLEGVYDAKPKTTIHYKPNTVATGTITAHLNNTARHPTKASYDSFLHIFGCRNSSGRLNPNYKEGVDTTIIFYEKIDPAQGERVNMNKTVNVYVLDRAPIALPWTNVFQAPNAAQLQGMNEAVLAWDAILSPLGMKLNLMHGEAPTQAPPGFPNGQVLQLGTAQLGIDNGVAGSVNNSYLSSDIKQNGSNLLIAANVAQVSRGWDSLSSAKLSAMSELSDGLIARCGQGEEPFGLDVLFVDNPQGPPDQKDIDYIKVRAKITGPLILKNGLEFEKTGTYPWPQKLLLGKDTSPWTVYDTYTASDGKPALRPRYTGGTLSASETQASQAKVPAIGYLFDTDKTRRTVFRH